MLPSHGACSGRTPLACATGLRTHRTDRQPVCSIQRAHARPSMHGTEMFPRGWQLSMHRQLMGGWKAGGGDAQHARMPEESPPSSKLITHVSAAEQQRPPQCSCSPGAPASECRCRMRKGRIYQDRCVSCQARHACGVLGAHSRSPQRCRSRARSGPRSTPRHSTEAYQEGLRTAHITTASAARSPVLNFLQVSNSAAATRQRGNLHMQPG